MKKNIMITAAALISALSFASCSPSAANNAQTPVATPPAITPAGALPTESVAPAETHEPKTAEGLLQAFKDAGLHVIDDVEYTVETDPNGLLGTPGQYIAKINFNDSDFLTPGSDPSIVIEVFSTSNDMTARKNYIQSIYNTYPMAALQFYFYENGVFLLRIPYDATQEQADAYGLVFNDYLNN